MLFFDLRNHRGHLCLKTCIILQISWPDNKKISFLVIDSELVKDVVQVFKELEPLSHLCNLFFLIDFVKYLTHDSYKHIHESNLSYYCCTNEQSPACPLLNLTSRSIVIKTEFTECNQVEVYQRIDEILVLKFLWVKRLVIRNQVLMV